MIRKTLLAVPALAALLLSACGGEGGARAASADAPPALPVDGARTMEAELAAFRADLPAAPTSFRGGSADADTLVALVVRALAEADTAAFEPLALDRAEFAWLYYPTNPQARPPYELPPSLMWFTLQGNNRKGVLRALERFGGRPVALRAWRCDRVDEQGENTVRSSCTVRLASNGGADQTLRLFGALIERGGRHKVLSYANDL